MLHSTAQNGVISPIGQICEGLHGPVAMARDDAGNLFVVEEFAHRIKKYDPEHVLVWEKGSRGNDNGEFQYPSDIALTQTGEILITNRWNHRVDVYSCDGTFIRSFGSFGEESGQFIEPWGICVDYAGDILVVDRGNARIVVYDAHGLCKKTFGRCGTTVDFYESERFKRTLHYKRWIGSLSRLNTIESRFYAYKYDIGDFEYPENIAINAEGHIYVSDRVSGHVVVFDKSGTYLEVLNSRKNGLIPASPSCIYSTDEHLFIGDELSEVIYYKRGKKEMQIDLAPLDLKPSAIMYCEKTGQLYIADAWSDRIVIARIEGEV